ncbi:hypothetical protein D3C72_1905650 [compost metagenome]
MVTITRPLPGSTILNSPERPKTTCTVPSSVCVSTVRIFSNSTTPSNLATMFDSAAMFDAVPPTWKVRSVNCVPGSPIDCAAITPTASPL